MDYYTKVRNAIKKTKLNQNTSTVLSNKIVDADNALVNDMSLGLPYSEEIDREHKIGNKILDFLDLANTGQHMDNVTVDEVKVILNAIQSIDANDFYMINSFNLGENNTFLDLFYNYCVSYTDEKVATTTMLKSFSKADLVAMITQYVFDKYDTVDKIKKSCNYQNTIYYKYILKYLAKLDNIFCDYLKGLHLIDSNKHFSIKKIKLLDNKKLIYNYCKYHCISVIKPNKFAQIIHTLFSAFRQCKHTEENHYTTGMIGIYFAYMLMVEDKNYYAIDDFKEDNDVYSIGMDKLSALIICLNLFADYVTQRAFRPNKVADQTINKITTCIPYDNKIWKIFDKIYNTKQKKGDSKDA